MAAAAPTGSAGRFDDAMRPSREFPRQEPQRRSAAGFFAVLVLVALLLAFFLMFTGVRMEQTPPPTPAESPSGRR